MTNVCKYCDEEFDSRNAVFRHLRSNKKCFGLATESSIDNTVGNNSSILKLEKRKVAVQFGYHVLDKDNTTGGNEVAAAVVRTSFFQALRALYPSSPVEEAEGESTFTLASAARLRHPSLMQETTCSAWSDVVGINYKGGPTDIDISSLVQQMQHIVQKDNGELLCVKVLNIESLMVSTKFHAEKSCSQRSYQYMIPMKWLDDSQETKDWVRQKLDAESGHQIQKCGTPLSIVKFKKALKLVESRDVTKASSSVVSSAGRFGKLWQKERRPFHNFCDPSLGSGGMASPSNEHVWRSVDKARLCGFVIDDENDDEALIVIEFRGDGFVAQQIRRMVASAVAIANGWLPLEYFDVATRSDIIIETSIAPSGLLYLSSARYHFVDLVKGSALFEMKDGNKHVDDWLASLQTRLLRAREETAEEENKWLKEVKGISSPRIRLELEQILLNDTLFKKEQILGKNDEKSMERPVEEDSIFSAVPGAYRKTLSLLRDIRSCGKWPRTADTRSRVIRSPSGLLCQEPDVQQHKRRAASSQFQGHLAQCGSFTIVNPYSFVGKLPAVNNQFPELVDAIFELEKHVSSKTSQSCLQNNSLRSESTTLAPTHCAVNSNIEFSPHFANGKGQEHSFSTIIGLGDYVGGEFVVDDKSYDIRYEALKFDGWKQIHSTKHFRGERFSLVFFTPDRRETGTSKGDVSFEDAKAMELVEAHALALPSHPILHFRQNSTDALVINEILGIDQGCTYELSPLAWRSMTKQNNKTEDAQIGFSLKGHEAMLDVGAHIGVFCRYALSVGCKGIIAYEPESENLKLLEKNLLRSNTADLINEGGVTIHQCAVAHGEPGMKNFVNARNRTDGSLNTWRHSLEKHSQYVDKKGTRLPSMGQESLLARSKVQTVPFFGKGGALVPGITFVKMDCEGAEVDILLSPESSHSSNWMDTKNLVFEWSFSKERRVQMFHKAIHNLESAGFNVAYEGQGSWWDTESNCMWPYHSDLVIFAMRK
eukprot:scaffold2736_cov264-Chaetoceros_neogracile.AAC.11